MGRLRGFVAPLKNCSGCKEPSEEGGEVEPFDAVTSELARCSSSYNLHANDRALMPDATGSKQTDVLSRYKNCHTCTKLLKISLFPDDLSQFVVEQY